MKKFKQSIISKSLNSNISLFKPEIKASRITITSRTCNQAKFDEFYNIIDLAKDYKNLVSSYCFNNLTSLVIDYSDFLTHYKLLPGKHLNSWEKQAIFQEVTGHYYETATRYLAKTTYTLNSQKTLFKNEQINQVKTRLNSIAILIDKESNLIITKNLTQELSYSLDFDVKQKLESLNKYLVKYKEELSLLQNKFLLGNNKHSGKNTQLKPDKEIISLENKISSYEKLILNYKEIEQFKLTKSLIYNKLINLISDKKLRLISKVKLGVYETGTHARHLDNAQLSIVKDLSNGKYQYFFKFRKQDKLVGREPCLNLDKGLDKALNKSLSKINQPLTKEFVDQLKLETQLKNQSNYDLNLAQYNKDNFIYLPLIFNHRKLKEIGRTIENILSKDNPQFLIKSEQLRIGQSSRKIHLIFKYEESSKLGQVIEQNLFIQAKQENTLAFDVNLKHNLLADSNGKIYDEILKQSTLNNKNKFIDNLNEIVLLQSIETEKRTPTQKYRYDKLLRSNEGLLKTYLSGLIKNWKSKNILHLVLEDLNFLNDKSYYEHAGVKIKYSRLSRLLRLGQIKIWIAQMAEKKGLFTHTVNPAYTSQECNHCHYISHLNRTKQESFKCTNKSCSHYNIEVNADTNAALNIKNRLLNKNLREKLNKDNVYLCSRPKPIYYKKVKTMIDEVYKLNGVVTELLPKQATSRLFIKEASSFRAR